MLSDTQGHTGKKGRNLDSYRVCLTPKPVTLTIMPLEPWCAQPVSQYVTTDGI